MQAKSQPETRPAGGVERAVYLFDQMPRRVACKPVEQPAEMAGLDMLARDLIFTCACHNGVGIAAPQIGVMYRVCVVNTKSEKLVLVNPQIIHSDGKQKGVEGCLSLPGMMAVVPRAKEVSVRTRLWRDGIVGDEIEIHAEGFEATVFQHEIDHLEGIFFIDRISSLKRGIFCRKFAKMRGGRRAR